MLDKYGSITDGVHSSLHTLESSIDQLDEGNNVIFLTVVHSFPEMRKKKLSELGREIHQLQVEPSPRIRAWESLSRHETLFKRKKFCN